jgi:hypothetical protein
MNSALIAYLHRNFVLFLPLLILDIFHALTLTTLRSTEFRYLASLAHRQIEIDVWGYWWLQSIDAHCSQLGLLERLKLHLRREALLSAVGLPCCLTFAHSWAALSMTSVVMGK